MAAWQALLLGIVEGLTEYIPVSSTGHLLVVQRLLGIPAVKAANSYAVAIQAGAIAAVLTLYPARTRQIIRGLVGADLVGARVVRRLVVAFIPAALIALAFEHTIEHYLRGLWPVVVAWIVGGIVILASARMRWSTATGDEVSLEAIGYKAAAAIGLLQCLALWPGTSRSLVTVLGGLAVGLSLGAALEFSFFLGVLTLGAASGYVSMRHGFAMFASYEWTSVTVGFIAAWLSAIVAVRWMVGYLANHGLGIFAYWRFCVGAATAALLLSGFL